MPRWHILALLCSLAGCRQATDEAQRACFPASPWHAGQGAPSAALSRGMLNHPLGSPALHAYPFKVRWTAGGTSEVTAAELLASPEGSLVPILHPLSMPAVFEVDAKQALVWGARGWGCVDRHSNGHDVYESHDALLAKAIDAVEASRQSSTNTDGYTFHEGLMVTIPGPLHVDPSDTAAAADPPRVARWECRELLAPLPQTPGKLPAMDALVTAKFTLHNCVTPVRIIKRAGDWAEVILPRQDSVLYRAYRFLVVPWADRPAGWVRLSAPGERPGTKKLLWHIERWHMGL